MQYEDMIFKVPVESTDYKENSEFVIRQMNLILDRQKEIGDNKIIINTNLRMGLPLENINKIAGPMIEAWAGEVFAGIRDDMNNPYRLVNVEAQERLGMADIILQFKKDDKSITGNVDVKATANDIPNSGKGPNITSFSRIRTAYVKDPDFMFIIISHKLQDSATANLIAKELKEIKVDCYLDVLDNSITENGKELTNHIRANLNKCTDIIVVMSSITKFSQWVPFEVGMAAQKDMPTATFLKEDVSLPDYLQYWPRLKKSTDIREYVSARNDVEREYYAIFESASQQRKTERFYDVLKQRLK